MNCDLCNGHILATMQVAWNGGNYHADCAVEALNQKRAAENTEDREIKEALESFDEFEDLQDDFDDLEPDEILDKPNIIIPEVVGTNGGNAPMTFPPGSVLVAPRAIIHPPQNGIMLGSKGSRYVTRNDLYDLPVPPRTSSWQPIPHYDFIRKLLDGLWDRRMIVTDEKYAVSSDGLKLYGLLTLQDEYDGVNYAIGLKNSNDKSTRLSLAVGYVVRVCSNGMVNGDYYPLTAKHTANFNLEDSLSVGIDRIKRGFLKLNGSIERKRDFQLSEGNAQELLYKAFMKFKLPISLLNTVHKELFIAPSFDEFKPLNLWSLENACTTSFKKLQPTSQFEATSKLAKFLDSCLN